MSDSEEQFESADAGAAGTFPQQASALRKNGYAMLKGQPCKIVDMSTSKTGKHGHAKIHFVGINIFNGKKYEDLCPSTHNMNVPNVTRMDYTVCDIDEKDGFVTLMNDEGETRSDLKLPEDQELKDQIVNEYQAGNEVVVAVMAAVGVEQIIQARVTGK